MFKALSLFILLAASQVPFGSSSEDFKRRNSLICLNLTESQTDWCWMNPSFYYPQCLKNNKGGWYYLEVRFVRGFHRVYYRESRKDTLINTQYRYVRR